jgi:hypothetical protein
LQNMYMHDTYEFRFSDRDRRLEIGRAYDLRRR